MMRRLLVLLGGIVALGALIPLGSMAPLAAIAQDSTPEAEIASTSATLARTDVRLVLPFGRDGLDADLATTGDVSGVCGFSSIMATGRADAWDCQGDDGQLYDPCFESPYAPADEPGQLACFASPFATDVVMLTLDEPLTREKEMAIDPDAIDPWALPWGIELANGERCTLLSEIDVVLAGEAVHYSCADGGSILGEVDRRLPVWAASYLADGATESTLVDVAIAWS
ncbi:MAG: hypothetical protein H0V00_11405 [Chloroflexia bacterium]|nr:hypothetical protein [Chloroflexia bacterium]